MSRLSVGYSSIERIITVLFVRLKVYYLRFLYAVPMVSSNTCTFTDYSNTRTSLTKFISFGVFPSCVRIDGHCTWVIPVRSVQCVMVGHLETKI